MLLKTNQTKPSESFEKCDSFLLLKHFSCCYEIVIIRERQKQRGKKLMNFCRRMCVILFSLSQCDYESILFQRKSIH